MFKGIIYQGISVIGPPSMRAGISPPAHACTVHWPLCSSKISTRYASTSYALPGDAFHVSSTEKGVMLETSGAIGTLGSSGNN